MATKKPIKKGTARKTSTARLPGKAPTATSQAYTTRITVLAIAFTLLSLVFVGMAYYQYIQ